MRSISEESPLCFQKALVYQFSKASIGLWISYLPVIKYNKSLRRKASGASWVGWCLHTHSYTYV